MTAKGKQSTPSKKGTIAFNHVVDTKSREKVDKKFEEIEKYCQDNQLRTPLKGVFVSAVLESSPVLEMSAQEFMERK